MVTMAAQGAPASPAVGRGEGLSRKWSAQARCPETPVNGAEVVRRCRVPWEQGLQGGLLVRRGEGVTKPWAGRGGAAGEEGACPGAHGGALPAHGPYFPFVKGGEAPAVGVFHSRSQGHPRFPRERR